MTKTTQQIPNAAKKKQPMTENTQKNNPEKWFTKYGTKTSTRFLKVLFPDSGLSWPNDVTVRNIRDGFSLHECIETSADPVDV